MNAFAALARYPLSEGERLDTFSFSRQESRTRLQVVPSILQTAQRQEIDEDANENGIQHYHKSRLLAQWKLN